MCADDGVRSTLLLLPGAFDGAVALLTHKPAPLLSASASATPVLVAARVAAVEAMEAAAARLVRNLTLSLVAGDCEDNAALLSATQVGSIHHTNTVLQKKRKKRRKKKRNMS